MSPLSPAQTAAAMAYNAKRGLPGHEHYAVLIAIYQANAGLVADGKHGPATDAAFIRRAGTTVPPPAPALEPFLGEITLDGYPKNYADRARVLGVPGDAKSDWYRANVVERQGANAFDGVPHHWYVKVHRLVEPFAAEAFRRASEASSYRIERCGSFVYRKVRKRTVGRLSSHAFAIAFDIDASRNALIDEDDIGEKLPEPLTPAWRELYPLGVDEPFVRAFESCGFRWGGDYHLHGMDYTDPMHFEWVGSSVFRRSIKGPT